MTIDPEEAVAIVESMGEYAREDKWFREYHGHDLTERVLAAVKPKGPFPLDLGGDETVKINGEGNLDLCLRADEIWTFLPNEMDRLVVAWLQYRGVDLKRLGDVVVWCGENSARTGKGEVLQFILNNAEAEE